MSRWARLLAWLEYRSDGLSPIVVKESRQVVRGREFLLPFMASLLVGLLVAFYGATEALSGASTAGRSTFGYLTAFLAFLGLAVVPLGAFGTLRQERTEQTLELITLTGLSSRRIVVGKLLSQSVKLLTLFAAIAPFMAMSFLLGGIDFTTILIALILLYMGSVWAGALCLFLSTLFKSRAASGLIFGVVGLLVIFVLFVGVNLVRVVSLGLMPMVMGTTVTGAVEFKLFVIVLTFWMSTLANFVLLAENRLSLATEDTVTPLRIGFFVQFLLMPMWTILWFVTTSRVDMVEALGGLGVIHLAVVAVFVLSEEMSAPRRVLNRLRTASGWRRVFALFGPGAGRGAAYILAQMIILAVFLAFFYTGLEQRRFLASCGYVCFFTGVPVLAFWRFAPARLTQFKLRVTVLCAFAGSLVLPDLIHYLIFRPEDLDISYSARHLINPFMTIAEWDTVESRGWATIPFAIGLIGLLAYIRLMRRGARATADAMRVEPATVSVGGEPGRGGILY